MQAAGDSGSLQGLQWSVLLADGHESGHLILGNDDFLAAGFGEVDVSWRKRGKFFVDENVFSLDREFPSAIRVDSKNCLHMAIAVLTDFERWLRHD